MSSPIRRVVTGKDATGKAIVLFDGPATNVHVRQQMGTTNTLLWVTDGKPTDLSANQDAAQRKIGVEPPPGGSILRVLEIAPEEQIPADYDTRLRLLREIGLAPEGPQRDRPRHPGMHRTATVDYAIILSGEIDMLLDDSEVHLKAGDVVVQRGTNHAWANRGNDPCRILFVLMDARQ